MTIYRVNGVEMTREEFTARKPLSGHSRAPLVAGDRGDYSRERDRKTGQDGRYYGQLARYPGDPRAVFRSKRAALDAAARRGMIEDKD